jgi:ribosomal protein L35AE/L33A
MFQDLSPITVKGKRITPKIDTETGKFHATVNDVQLSSNSLQELEQAISQSMRRSGAKIAIHFCRKDKESSRVMAGTITGVHGRTGNYLITWEDGTKTQDDSFSWTGSRAFLDLTKSEREVYVKLLEEADKANKALYAFQKAHEMDMRSVVNKAINEAADKQ